MEHRFHSHTYTKRFVDMENRNDNTSNNGDENKECCSHSIHKDYIQYFSYNGVTASFIYTPIKAWEIGLPSLLLTLHKWIVPSSEPTLEEIKLIAQSGYGVYAKIYDELAHLSEAGEFPLLPTLKIALNRDQLYFREKVSCVQTVLSEQLINIYDVYDSLLVVKKTLADSIDLWSSKLVEAANQNRNSYAIKQTPPLETVVPIDSGTICTEDFHPESPVPLERPVSDLEITTKNDEDIDTKSELSPVKQQQNDITPLRDDRKSVKMKLLELLPSEKPTNYCIISPFPTNEHYCLPVGKFPVLVHSQDLSSVIAYSLVSNEYTISLDAQQSNAIAVVTNTNTPSPNVKRKSQDGSIDTDETITNKDTTDKKSKSTSHIDIYFQVIHSIIGTTYNKKKYITSSVSFKIMSLIIHSLCN